MNKELKLKFKSISNESSTKLERMAWDDGTSYKDIFTIFKLTPGEVEKFMRYKLSYSNYKRWRLRLTKRSHKKGRSPEY